MLRMPLMIGLFAGLVGVASVARAAESVQLLDGTRIVGTIIHYFDGVLTVELPNGTRMKLPSAKVRSLRFKLPKPRASMSTPRKAFKRLRTAALKGDLATYIDCHSSYYQMFLQHQIERMGARKFTKRLKKEWGAVQLKVLKTKRKGNTAVMTFRGQQGEDRRDGEVRFVRENREWKMILPL